MVVAAAEESLSGLFMVFEEMGRIGFDDLVNVAAAAADAPLSPVLMGIDFPIY